MCVSSTMLQTGAVIAQGISDSNTQKANAKFALIEGKSALDASNHEASQIRNAGERFQGTTTVAQTHAGADLTSGSAALVAAESEKNIELDALVASYKGQQAHWAKSVEAKMLKRQAKATLWNTGLSAGATILGGVEKAATAGMGGK